MFTRINQICARFVSKVDTLQWKVSHEYVLQALHKRQSRYICIMNACRQFDLIQYKQFLVKLHVQFSQSQFHVGTIIISLLLCAFHTRAAQWYISARQNLTGCVRKVSPRKSSFVSWNDSSTAMSTALHRWFALVWNFAFVLQYQFSITNNRRTAFFCDEYIAWNVSG